MKIIVTMPPDKFLVEATREELRQLDELADAMDEGGEDAKAAARDAALAKLTDAEKAALGVE